MAVLESAPQLRYAARPRRCDRLIKVLDGKKVAIVTHDNPDPDSIATGWALVALLRQKTGQTPRLIGRGAIVRAENLHMVRLLNPPIELVDEVPQGDTAVVLVDCVPTGRNHLLDGSPASVSAVIDHHELHGEPFRVAYRDIRPHVAATASIAAGYLREQGIEPDPALATALLFAIRTEIIGEQNAVSRSDRIILAWLSRLADHAKLAEIEWAPLPKAYYSDLLLALENVFIYDDAAVCFLPQASGAQIVGEVADIMIRCEGIQKVLCGAPIENDMVLSVRTSLRGGDAVRLTGATLRGLGGWGGHEHRAGGKIPAIRAEGKTVEALCATLKERWLAACKVDQQRGSRLVRKQDILEHL